MKGVRPTDLTNAAMRGELERLGVNSKGSKTVLLQKLIDHDAISQSAADEIKAMFAWTEVKNRIRSSVSGLPVPVCNLGGKTVCFVGSMSSKNKKTFLRKLAKEAGATVSKSPSDPATDIIVCGCFTSYRIFQRDVVRSGKSYNAIWNEEDFRSAVALTDPSVNIDNSELRRAEAVIAKGGLDGALARYGYGIFINGCKTSIWRTKEQIEQGITLRQARKLRLAELQDQEARGLLRVDPWRNLDNLRTASSDERQRNFLPNQNEEVAFLNLPKQEPTQSKKLASAQTKRKKGEETVQDETSTTAKKARTTKMTIKQEEVQQQSDLASQAQKKPTSKSRKKKKTRKPLVKVEAEVNSIAHSTSSLNTTKQPAATVTNVRRSSRLSAKRALM